MLKAMSKTAKPKCKSAFETENRLICTTKGRRLKRVEGMAAIVTRLQAALPNLLPRAPRRPLHHKQ